MITAKYFRCVIFIFSHGKVHRFTSSASIAFEVYLLVSEYQAPTREVILLVSLPIQEKTVSTCLIPELYWNTDPSSGCPC